MPRIKFDYTWPTSIWEKKMNALWQKGQRSTLALFLIFSYGVKHTFSQQVKWLAYFSKSFHDVPI